MHRLALSVIAGFVLIYVQSLLVMKINGYRSIEFDNLSLVFTLWAFNIFIVYSLLFPGKRRIQED